MPRIPFRRRRSLTERIADKLSETTSHLSEQTHHAASSIADKAAHSTEHLRKQGAAAVSDLNAQAAERVRTVSAHSPDLDSERLMQEARDVAQNAAHSALDLWERARSRSGAAASTIPTREQINQQLGIAAASIGGKTREAQAAMQKGAAGVKDRVHEIEPAVGEKIGVAKERTTEIADETAKAGKNVGALLFWLSAAVAIVYFLILDRDRREKVWNTTKAAGSEVRDLVQDVRGHDGEFAS